MKIYIASAMFSKEEKQRINKIASLFRKLGHEVYVPHEFKVPNDNLMPNNDWAQAIFSADVKAIDECDVVYYFCEGMDGTSARLGNAVMLTQKAKRFAWKNLKKMNVFL